MSGLSKPSTKGYAAVPTEERIDDDVETPQNDAEAEEDDDLYTARPSAPLLSNRSRGNEPPRAHGKECWYHSLTNLNPFGGWRSSTRPWDPPSKPRKWGRIFVFSLFGVLLLTILGLGLATGILNKKYHQARNRGCSGRYYNYGPHTHVATNRAYDSSNDNLNFKRLYPPIETSGSSACEVAWNMLQNVPCHEKIWNRSWDDGKQTSIFDPEPNIYAGAVCTPRCTDHIATAFQFISSQCTEDDKFDLSEYEGPFMLDSALEEGPLGVITTIARRVSHMCRKDPMGGWSASYCSAVMWEDWRIVDGMNTGNLNGLDAFEFKTRRSQEEGWRNRNRYYSHQDTCDDVYYYNNRYHEPRRWGPNVNSTTCDWCTINWFERKLLSWKKDQVQDPKTGATVELQDYLKRVKKAGERCDADAWNRVWAKALRKYKASGDLPDDWEKDNGNAFEVSVGDDEELVDVIFVVDADKEIK